MYIQVWAWTNSMTHPSHLMICKKIKKCNKNEEQSNGKETINNQIDASNVIIKYWKWRV